MKHRFAKLDGNGFVTRCGLTETWTKPGEEIRPNRVSASHHDADVTCTACKEKK